MEPQRQGQLPPSPSPCRSQRATALFPLPHSTLSAFPPAGASPGQGSVGVLLLLYPGPENLGGMRLL